MYEDTFMEAICFNFVEISHQQKLSCWTDIKLLILMALTHVFHICLLLPPSVFDIVKAAAAALLTSEIVIYATRINQRKKLVWESKQELIKPDVLSTNDWK